MSFKLRRLFSIFVSDAAGAGLPARGEVRVQLETLPGLSLQVNLLIASYVPMQHFISFSPIGKIVEGGLCQRKEMTPMTEKMIDQQCQQTWNSLGRVPIHQWLVDKWVEGDRDRLNACGNLVMPQVANLALNILCARNQK